MKVPRGAGYYLKHIMLLGEVVADHYFRDINL